MMNTNRDAIYARYSSHSQDDGTSIEVQLDACRKIAGNAPLEFIDRAVTGRTMNRHAFNQMLEAAERKEFSRLIVYRYDRIGRSAHTHGIASDLEDMGIEIISCSEGKDTLSRGIHFVVGQDFSKKLSERVTDSLHKRFDQRSWTGGPSPYGYRIDHRKNSQYLAPDPVESEVVKFIIKTYLNETAGFKEIARQLSARGIKTRKGNAFWAFTTVKLILSNSCLVGEVRFGKRKMKLNKATGRRVPVRLDPSTHRSYTEESLRIISDEDFERVQLKLASKSRPRGATQARRVVRPFTGLIYCSECNGVFYAQKSTNRHDNAKSKHYYSCSCRARNGAAACSNSEIYREDSLVAEVLATYQGIFTDTDSIIAEITSEAQKQIDSNRDDASRMRSELAASTKLTDGLAGLLLDPEMAREAKGVIKRRIADEGAKQESLQANLDRLVERANRTSERLIEMVSRVFSEARETFDAVGSPEKLHAFMERFVGPSVSHPDGRLLPMPANENGSGGSGSGLNGYIAATGIEPVTLGL
jgi:site-specific DNA recombinase